MRDIILEARTQLAYARMAAEWLDGQIWEYLGHFDHASAVSADSPGDVALLRSQAELFRSALQPALSTSVLLSVFSLMEQALLRVCERHAAYGRDKRGWAKIEGSGVARASTYLRRVCSPAVTKTHLLRDLNDLRLIRNHLAHRGPDFNSAPRGAAEAAANHGVLRADGSADPEKILAWMFDLQTGLLDQIERDLVGDRR